MPDDLQGLARAAAANVVTAMATEAWPRTRAALLDVLARHGNDPGAAAWVDAFGNMIAAADGREQMSLRDAAYARFESVFASLLAARPNAAPDLAALAAPSSPGHGAPAPAGPQLVKEPTPPQSAVAPQASPYAPNPQYGAPPAPGTPAPPPPPGPPPASAMASPYGSPQGGPYQGPPTAGGMYQGVPGQMPGSAAPRGAASGKWVLGSIVVVAVVVGAIFGGIAVFGGSDDDDCASASAQLRAVSAPDGCGDPVGAPPGAGTVPGGSADGPSGQGSGDVDGSWTGTYVNEKPAKLDGPFSVAFVQSGGQLTGELELSVPGCEISGPVTGTLSGKKVSLRSTSGTPDQIRMEGTLSGDRLSGTYTTSCNNASGTWTAEKE